MRGGTKERERNCVDPEKKKQHSKDDTGHRHAQTETPEVLALQTSMRKGRKQRQPQGEMCFRQFTAYSSTKQLLSKPGIRIWDQELGCLLGWGEAAKHLWKSVSCAPPCACRALCPAGFSPTGRRGAGPGGNRARRVPAPANMLPMSSSDVKQRMGKASKTTTPKGKWCPYLPSKVR